MFLKIILSNQQTNELDKVYGEFAHCLIEAYKQEPVNPLVAILDKTNSAAFQVNPFKPEGISSMRSQVSTCPIKIMGNLISAHEYAISRQWTPNLISGPEVQ